MIKKGAVTRHYLLFFLLSCRFQHQGKFFLMHLKNLLGKNKHLEYLLLILNVPLREDGEGAQLIVFGVSFVRFPGRRGRRPCGRHAAGC